MSKGYYIYLDRRDVGKGDMWFVGWFNVTTNKMWDGNTTMEHEGYMPVFSIPGNRVVFDDKKTADDMVKMIASLCPEIEELLHVEVCEEEDDHD